MIRITKWSVFCLLVFSGACVGPDKPLPKDKQQRISKMYDACLICHSTREMQRGPIIDGMHSWYVLSQLQKFESGIRGTITTNRSEFLMGSNVGARVPKADIKLLAQYIGSLEPKKHLITLKGDADKGEKIYAQCTACHGKAGEGRKLLKGPALATLEDWYQLDQLRKFKSNQRGYHEKDTQGRIMAVAVQALSDQDLKNVTVYIAEKLSK